MLSTSQLTRLVKEYRLTAGEVRSHHKTFQEMTKTGSLSVFQYCKKLESLGIEPDLGERLFSAMCRSSLDYVSFEEYLSCMDIIANGTEDEQAELSFRLISKGKPDPITYAQFSDMMRSMRKLLSFGESEGNARVMFAQLDSDHGQSIDMREYKVGWKTNPQLFKWFELLTSRITGKTKAETGTETVVLKIVDLEKDVRDCLTLLRPKSDLYMDEIEGFTPEVSDTEADDISLDEISVLPSCDLLGQKPVLMASHRSSRSVTIFDNPQSHQLPEKLQSILLKLHALKSLLKGEVSPTDIHRKSSTLQSCSSTAVSWCDENWNFAVNTLQGIHKAVKLAEDNELQSSDASIVEQKRRHVIIPLSVGSETGQKVYKFHDYAPIAFDRLRQLYGISATEYLRFLGVDRVLDHWMQGNFLLLDGLQTNENKDGFTYFSENQKFVIKTITKEEFGLIRRKLKDYFQYMNAYPNSLLPRIYGLHKLLYKKHGQVEKLRLIVVSNLLSNGREIVKKFTLTGRKRVEAGLEVDPDNPDIRLNLGIGRKKQLISILEQDCRFLQSRSLTGYFVTIGVHLIEKSEVEISPETVKFVPFAEMNNGGLQAETGKSLYFIGIEEVFKEAENRAKGQQYAERLITRVKTIIQ